MIPYVRDMDPAYGQLTRVSPKLRRITCRNPGPFTFLGTGVYVVGEKDVAVIDPGPDDAEHFEALKRALDGMRVSHVLVTHTHADHSPLAHPLAQWAGCKVHGSGVIPQAELVNLEAGEDEGFRADVQLADGDVISGEGWTLEAIATPGHMSNHICYALREENALLSGDHIMGWSTTVISPPDGNMNNYFRSLEKVRARNFATLYPTHGPAITEPTPFIDALVKHRLAREQAILDRLAAGDTSIPEMVKVIYKDVNPMLHPAAAHSVLAHMIRLVETGKVIAEGSLEVAGGYRLT